MNTPTDNSIDYRQRLIQHMVCVGVHEPAARTFVSGLRGVLERESEQYWCELYFNRCESTLTFEWYGNLQDHEPGFVLENDTLFIASVSSAFDITEELVRQLLPFVHRPFFLRDGLAHWLKLIVSKNTL